MTSQSEKAATERIIPPYNGFGSEEDSLGNCLSLLPRPPRRNFVQLMDVDKAGYDGQVLRFLATTADLDEQRTFIISYFLADATISVFEQADRNSGMYRFVVFTHCS